MVDSALLMRAASWTPEQKDLYTRLTELMVRRNPRGRRLVAVEGRDGTHPDVNHESHRRYREAHDLYERASTPRRKATFIVDNTDWRKPIQSFADSC